MWHRFTGHSISDADVYRTDEERKEGEKQCPVGNFKKYLVSRKILKEEEFANMQKRADEEIEAAVRYSEKECTDPDPADILRGVYSNNG
jgi:pyruvate dehydrogenase E1 component alpha subunit